MTKRLVNKRVLIGICGGIAAYKSADLVRRLRVIGSQVRVVMTSSATEFVTPLTFRALSGQPVAVTFQDSDADHGMGHIELARWADVILVVPASANVIAKLAHGLADDLLSTVCLAADGPVVIVPAMNPTMWQHAATQDNVNTLIARGVHIFGPAQGAMACGESGDGRMLEPEQLIPLAAGLFESHLLDGVRVLVSAGPTREPLDPVRYISNRSSGRMGIAVADAAFEAGAKVTLVTGPVSISVPKYIERVNVETADQMQQAVLQHAKQCDIFIAAAAVADYKPIRSTDRKEDKSTTARELDLQITPDILASVTALAYPPFTVGFAAETHDVFERARQKRERKQLDMIAANWVGQPDRGFDASNNALELIWENGNKTLPLAPKEKLARQLVTVVAERYHARNPSKNSRP